MASTPRAAFHAAASSAELRSRDAADGACDGSTAEVGRVEAPDRGQVTGHVAGEGAEAAGRQRHHDLGPAGPLGPPPPEHRDGGRLELVGGGTVTGERVAHHRAPLGGVGEDDGAALLGHQVRRDPAALAEGAAGPHLARLQHVRLAAQDRGDRRHGLVRRPLAQRLRQPAEADRAPPARRRAGVVQRLLQQLHQAAPATGVVAHDVGLAASRGHDAVVVLAVVGPRGSTAHPSLLDPLDRAVDGQLLEHQLDPPPPQPGLGLQLGNGGRRPVGVGLEPGQQPLHLVGVGDGGRGEVVPHAGVGVGRQQGDHRVVDATAGTPHLLVVRHRRGRRADVDDEPEVGLVVAHAERGGGDQRLEPVAAQSVLEPLPLSRLEPARVGGDRQRGAVPGGDRLGQPLGVRDGERVDDARPGQVGQLVHDPGVAVEGRERVDHGQLQAVAGQRAAQHEGAVAQLGRHVVGDPLVRRGGRGQHRGLAG